MADGRQLRTDWNEYYLRPPGAAALTRRYTAWRLVRTIRAHCAETDRLVVAEFGGANSCFLTALVEVLGVRSYHIVDSNEQGLRMSEKLRERVAELVLWNRDVRTFDEPIEADVCFSVGLVEHFGPEETRATVARHFAATRPGGLVLIAFPTPTWLYRAARACAEASGTWRFWDERPLRQSEVLSSIDRAGQLLHQETLWPIVFTQRLLALRKAEP